MMNLVSHGVSATRIAALSGLIAALGAGAALSETGELSVGERKEAVYLEIFHERIASGEVIMTGPASSLSGAGMTESGGSDGDPPLPCFPQGQSQMLMDGRVADATLMLMAVYRIDGTGISTSMYGTGTVIRAETGINRVLTAAHVANPQITTAQGEPATLSSIHAFDGEGRLVVNLEPVLHSAPPIQSGEISHDLIHRDVMVLAPQAFPSPEMALSWEGRGVEVSPVQSVNLMTFHGEGNRSFVAPGYSGAALLDPEGRAVGLVTEILPALNSYRPAGNTAMPEAVLSWDHGPVPLLTPIARELLEEVASGPSAGVMVDAVAGGPPLSSPRVLSALGVNPDGIEFVEALDTDLLFSAGFPGRECRASWLTYVPRMNLPFLDRTEAHVTSTPREPFVYTETPGKVMILHADGEVRPPEPQTGFGMSDFLSTIDALTRSVPPDLTVTDPFAGPAPQQSMEGPR